MAGVCKETDLGKEKWWVCFQREGKRLKSMQMFQLPQTTEYYSFEYGGRERADLYGMRLQINYSDGTKRIVEGTEHSVTIEVPDTFGETLYAYTYFET